MIRDSLRNETAKQQRIEEEMREKREQQRMDIAKLNLLINQAEEQMVKLRKRYETAVKHRDNRFIQIVQHTLDAHQISHVPLMTLIFIMLNLYFIACSYSTNFSLFLVLLNFHIVHYVSVAGLENDVDFINYVCSTHLLSVLHWMLGLFLFILVLFS